MVWTPLADRLASLPLILAGPILRRTTSRSVTVWLALRQAQSLELTIKDAAGITFLSGTAATVSVGSALHIVAVTADEIAAGPLEEGRVYQYNIVFNGTLNLTSSGVLDGVGYSLPIAYAPAVLPSFALPPDDISKLRILHGSCRKPHGESLDAMPAIDSLIAADATDGLKRPHQLFLTGDQIYADDVADGLLFMLRDASKTLLGWDEALPDITEPKDLQPGHRVSLSRKAGFTASLKDDDKVAKSHLMTFGEFAAMYLFAWSDVLWPTELPTYTEVFGTSNDFDRDGYALEIKRLGDFKRYLWHVRRLFANVPTYMIGDDHEITDDWFINLRWCKFVLSTLLGRRVVQNGLAALAVFQAWGNAPEQFAPATNPATNPGDRLLQALVQLNSAAGADTEARKAIAHSVGLPASDSEALDFIHELEDKRYLSHIGTQPWHKAIALHFHIQWAAHEVIGLDTRTWRAFGSSSDTDYPHLLSDEGFIQQIKSLATPLSTSKATFVLVPGPVIGVPFIEGQQETGSDRKRLDRDSEAWGLHQPTFERFFAQLALRTKNTHPDRPFILLCGDVHYGYTTRLQYWSNNLLGTSDPTTSRAIFAQLTASSFKNENVGDSIFSSIPFLSIIPIRKGTRTLHRVGYKPYFDLLPFVDRLPEVRQILGYANPSRGRKLIGTRTRLGATINWETERGDPALVYANDPGFLADIGSLTVQPDWRYRVDYLLAAFEIDDKFQPVAATPPTSNRQQALQSYLQAAENYDDYAERWGNGKELVGVNNFGEVRFDWGAGSDKTVSHLLWWRLEDESEDNGLLEPFPLSKFVVSLNFEDSRYPQPPVD